MTTQIRNHNSACVFRNADLVLKDLVKGVRTDTPHRHLSLTILCIRNAIQEMLVLRQSLKRRKEHKAKLDLYINTNFGLQGMANI